MQNTFIPTIFSTTKKALAVKAVKELLQKDSDIKNKASDKILVLEKLGDIIKKNKGVGAGGAKTNENGLSYETLTDLSTHFMTSRIHDKFKYIKFTEDGTEFVNVNKNSLHKFMESIDEKQKDITPASGCKSPDEAYVNIENKRLIIVEKKYQIIGGSVDEKLQTGDFKKLHYSELFPNYQVSYIYCLSNWFKKPEYESVLKYLKNNSIPVFWGEEETYKKDIIEFITNSSL
jgi:hypothetical protein